MAAETWDRRTTRLPESMRCPDIEAAVAADRVAVAADTRGKRYCQWPGRGVPPLPLRTQNMENKWLSAGIST